MAKGTEKTKKIKIFKFKNLTRDDRLVIERMHNSGKFSAVDIALAVGVNRSTIYRELEKGYYMHRKSDWTEEQRYSTDLAQGYADNNKGRGGRPYKVDFVRDRDFLEFMAHKIKEEQYSPAAALATGRKEKRGFISISIKTAYRYIYGGIIKASKDDLPVGPYDKAQYTEVVRKRPLPLPGKSIEKRPEHVMNRDMLGHWEMDTVVGKQGESKKSLLVLTERMTRLELIFLLLGHTAECVVDTLNRLEAQIKYDFSSIFKSLSVDNGSEFADAQGIMGSSIEVGKERLALYYCHPRSACERGTNENNNRLIRRFIPKGTNFDGIPDKDISGIQHWMNNYPRKILSWDTSLELFFRELEKLGIKDMDAVRGVFARNQMTVIKKKASVATS